jgi:hypothetical protein
MRIKHGISYNPTFHEQSTTSKSKDISYYTGGSNNSRAGDSNRSNSNLRMQKKIRSYTPKRAQAVNLNNMNDLPRVSNHQTEKKQQPYSVIQYKGRNNSQANMNK